MSAQATRLESLFLLVRDGSSAQIRENAAEKLGEVAVRSPEACASILQQLRPLIVDVEWEIRVASSKCLDVVARSLRHERQNVADLYALVSLGSLKASCTALNLQTVDINAVVREGAPLLRSGGEEYRYITNLTEEERRVHAVKQRRLLLRRLSGAGGPIWKTREDSLTKQLLPRLNQDHAKEIADDIEASEAQPGVTSEPAAGINRKQASEMLAIPTRSKRRPGNDTGETRSDEKRMKVDPTDDPEDIIMKQNGLDTRTDESETQTKASIVASLVSDLFESMFDSKWEVRHGAVLSLRQILLSAHFTTAVEAARPVEDMSTQRCFVDKWLEECLIRCICVLALDQFVDYSADGSVSPVREFSFFAMLAQEKLDAQSQRVQYLLDSMGPTLSSFAGNHWKTLHPDVMETRIIEVFSAVGISLGSDLILYVPSLVHYAMKTMSSQFKIVRTLAAAAFADLVPLIPLQMDLKLHESNKLLPDALRTIVNQNAVSRTFLESFTEGKAIQHVDVTSWLAPDISLRVYQQHGVDWLCFMANNNLHGILADDMGLGKTLQSLSAMAATLSMSSTPDKRRAAVSCLIVCPPIIVHHWIQEAKKFLPGFFESMVDYSLPASERKTLNRGSGLPSSDHGPTLIVTTYAILRTDIDYLSSIDYSFVVLDEAHLIRNPSTALFRAVLELRATHRVALSGTPLQNNVTDLWALFEFLMPGYLDEFAEFRREFVLPITKSKERNATTKQKELAAIAIAQLHQKVLPFILRRTKDQVLEELPPKIISNVLLPLSSLQKRLYSLASSIETETTAPSRSAKTRKPDTKPLTNVLTNLQLLRKICVHPALVADSNVTRGLSTKEKKGLCDWKNSGKMTGLRDLLVECCDVAAWDQGSCQGSAADADGLNESNISPHRCLVFAHLQGTLDLTEQMLRVALPGVTYRRLDGKTPHAKRADIVQHFNSDPSIDVLLLTTSVGGLGLTLTGADTVIFIEHSWNPFVDLQAMDRAHRIGQKRTVRVFRLIMEGSLEEHILNLQEFKEQVAATVVQKSDAQTSMNTNTKGVLNLLQTSSSAVAAKELRASVAAKKAGDDKIAAALPQGAQELLDQIGDLWDESQYDSLAFPEPTNDE
ncbi:TATA-binding protein-associated factor [Phytophthora fragariae]|uniref:TATA-binding protein-associated factor n=1 Tax=Phytophthora fragariae TaxID=53985 RepID=A0A6G0PF79_9STRA|nr:TATA-binding protein-associated factor [Phytophthora fragariae]